MKVLVGMTSWSKRIGTAALTLRSILTQTRPADSVELTLDLENFPNGHNDLPPEVLELEAAHDNFHIYFEPVDYKVWLKSVPVIRRHAGEDYVLFTLDDDCTYFPDYIEKAVAAFEKYPDCAYMNTSTSGIAGEYMLYRSSLLEKCRPYLTNEFIAQVKVDDCCWFWFMRKFDAKMAPPVGVSICQDRMQGYSYRREFSNDLPEGVDDVSRWTRMDGTYPMPVLQREMAIIQKHLDVH